MSATNDLFTPFSSSQSKGVYVIGIFALLSTLAFLFKAFRVVRAFIQPYTRGKSNDNRALERLFFRTQLGIYAACLVLSNVFLSLAGLIEFNWANEFGISQGALCRTQAVFMQIGTWATSYFTIAIAFHTCNSLIFGGGKAPWLGRIVISLGWAVAIVAGIAPSSNDAIYGPAGAICGVTSGFSQYTFVLEALPLILGDIASGVLYSTIFLVHRGNLRVKGGIRFFRKSSTRRSALEDVEEYQSFIGAVANTLLWYPIAYAALLLPHLAIAIRSMTGSVPFNVAVFAHICCFLLGLANVALLYNTFRELSPFIQTPPPEKSFGDKEKAGADLSQLPSRPPIALKLLNKDNRVYENHRRSSSSSSSSSRHSRTSSSSSSVGSEAELLRNDKRRKSYRFARSKMSIDVTPATPTGALPPVSVGMPMIAPAVLQRQGETTEQVTAQGITFQLAVPLITPLNSPTPAAGIMSTGLSTGGLSPHPTGLPLPVTSSHLTVPNSAAMVPSSPASALRRQIAEASTVKGGDGRRSRTSSDSVVPVIEVTEDSPVAAQNIVQEECPASPAPSKASQAKMARKPFVKVASRVPMLPISGNLGTSPSSPAPRSAVFSQPSPAAMPQSIIPQSILPPSGSAKKLTVPGGARKTSRKPAPLNLPAPTTFAPVKKGNTTADKSAVPRSAQDVFISTPLHSAASVRPLPQLPETRDSLSSAFSHVMREASVSARSSSASYASRSSYSSTGSSNAGSNSLRPLPTLPSAGNKTDSVASFSTREDANRRATALTVWSQDSAGINSAVPQDAETMQAYAALRAGVVKRGSP